ncbi:MAG TPA: RDD family protein [Solirubrobacteraceae bacterium]|nr:RDD family protein [Solirubrobacteraceae bacterium]
MTATQQPDPFGGPPPTTDGPSGPRAGFWIRFGASLLDGIVLFIGFGILAVAIDPGVAYALYILGNVAYFTVLEGSPSGQTLGKKACGIRVIDYATGGSIGMGRAFIRWIGKQISGIVLALGYLWMLWDKEKQTWHDKMANSVVVPESAYPVG